MPILQAIYGLLLAVGPTISLGCFVMAGLKLREEGGINFHAGRGFTKWLFWAALFLTLPGLQAWLQQMGFHVPTLAPGARAYTLPLQSAITNLVVSYLVERIVPILASLLLFKAVMDNAEGKSPIPSLVSAMFVLSVSGIYILAQGWATNGAFATAELLWSMSNYLFSVISPIVGALCIVGAIINYIRNRDWANLVWSGIGFLSIWGLWALLQMMVGVHVS